jgi:hypothetical protein
MIPQPSEFLDLFSADRRRREAAAAAERQRDPGTLRAATASALRAFADRLAPASVPPRTVTSPAAAHPLRPASSHCRHAA